MSSLLEHWISSLCASYYASVSLWEASTGEISHTILFGSCNHSRCNSVSTLQVSAKKDQPIAHNEIFSYLLTTIKCCHDIIWSYVLPSATLKDFFNFLRGYCSSRVYLLMSLHSNTNLITPLLLAKLCSPCSLYLGQESVSQENTVIEPHLVRLVNPLLSCKWGSRPDIILSNILPHRKFQVSRENPGFKWLTFRVSCTKP